MRMARKRFGRAGPYRDRVTGAEALAETSARRLLGHPAPEWVVSQFEFDACDQVPGTFLKNLR
jgi:hypothetical protein